MDGTKLSVPGAVVDDVPVVVESEEHVECDPLYQVVVIVLPDPVVYVVVATNVLAVCPTSYVYVVAVAGVVIATVGSAFTVTADEADEVVVTGVAAESVAVTL